MLKKGSLLSKGEQRNFIYLTIGNPSGYTIYGYSNDPFRIDRKTGAIDRIPYWEWEGADGIFRKWYLAEFYANDGNNYCYMTLRYDNPPERGMNAKNNLEIIASVSLVEGEMLSYHYYNYYYDSSRIDYGSPTRVTVPAMKKALGSTVKVTFTPPLPDICKKVKQVFTRSRKEGVVNAWEGNAYRVGYTRKGKYHQRHGLHCTGDPRWKFSLDYTSWQDRKGQRTYRGCGISIFPRLGWKLTRAYHHGHIEKYITHWLYRFPSKAPNGGLIRKYRLNLGVTSQLEAPYAA